MLVNVYANFKPTKCKYYALIVCVYLLEAQACAGLSAKL